MKVETLKVKSIFIAKNNIFGILALYLGQGVSFLFPLLILPIIAKVFTPVDVGNFLAAQSLSFLIMGMVEYGFVLTASRSLIKRIKPFPIIISSVQTAKLLLIFVYLLALLSISLLSSTVSSNLGLFIAAFAGGCFSGLIPNWYFQASSRIFLTSSIDASLKLFALLMIWLFPFFRSSPIIIIATFSFASFLSMSISTFMMYKEQGDSFYMNIKGSLEELREGLNIFGTRIIGLSYTSALGFILSLFHPAVSVANFILADRINKIIVQPVSPITQAFYPYFVSLSSNRKVFIKSVMYSGALALAYSLIFAIIIYLLKETIIQRILTDKFPQVYGYLSLMLVSAPFITLNTVLNNLFIISSGLDKLAFSISLCAGIFNVTAILISPLLGLNIVIFSIIFTEIAISIIYMLNILKFSKMDEY